MKLFSDLEYIDNELFISEGILDSLTKIFGKGVDAISGIKSFGKGISELPEKTRLTYKLTMSSIKDIVDEEEKQAVKSLLEKYKGVSSLDEIATLNYKYLSRKAYPDSKFTSNLILLTKELCIKSKNVQVKGYLNKLFNLGKKSSIEDIEKKIEKEVEDKKEVKPEYKKEVERKKESPKVEEPSKVDTPIEKETPTEKAEEITKVEVEKTVKRDPIKDLAEKVNLDSTLLYNEIFNKVSEDKSLIEDADDIILGISSIVCGALLLKNTDKINTIFKSIGIENSEEFINKIKKVAK